MVEANGFSGAPHTKVMGPLLLAVAVVILFALIVGRERYRVSARPSSCYKIRRGRLANELHSVDKTSWDALAYRWKRRRRADRMYYFARIVVTQSALYLSYRLLLLPVLAVPLVLPSYCIPLADIADVRWLEDDKPTRYFRLHGLKPMKRLAVETYTNGTCIVEFAEAPNVASVQRTLSELIHHEQA